MKYTLLTGATGLVGRYLLRDLLALDIPVAVLTRSNRVEPATQRIEALMSRWQRLAGRNLPRPVVIEADLRQPLLGLTSEARRWVAANCDRMLHNAASMTFREDKHGEPFRTNVEGMRNVLELCRQAGVRQFHHVSTAYICGLRSGRVYETEVDLGQQNGNVYEVSKLAAEKMLRSADFFDQYTIYRPASVVGDSATGYTVSSHGFYLPLQLAFVIADRVPTHLMGERFFRLLGLRGDEGKNLVPVDWLSAAIVELFKRPECHGQTYHMTNPRPVTVRLIQQVVQEAIEKYSTQRFVGTLSEEQIVAYEHEFQQHMEVYRSHWRDDPAFDCTNTQRALPNLPCPEIDYDMLLRIASYPVKERFVLKRPEPVASGFQPAEHLRQLAGAEPAAANGSPAISVGLEVSGAFGGHWHLLVQAEKVVAVEPGLSAADRWRYYLNSESFGSLVRGDLSIDEAIRTGRLLVEGDLGAQGDFARIFESIVSPSCQAGRRAQAALS